MRVETYNDDWDKGRNGTISDHGEEGNGKHEPEFLVPKELQDLRPLEVRVSDTRVVGAQSSNGDITLPIVEPLGSHWVRRKDPP